MLSWLCLLVLFCTLYAAATFSDQTWHGFPSFSGIVVYYDFDVPRDLLVVSRYVRSHFFGIFYSSYFGTHLRLVGRVFVIVTKVSPPLRSRAHPSGFPDLSPSNRDKVHEANNTLETVAWASYLAVHVSKRKTFLFLMMPEDFGGHRVSCPASPRIWKICETLRVNEAVRGATFLCRFASADQKHPGGCSHKLSYPLRRPLLGLASNFSVLLTS